MVLTTIAIKRIANDVKYILNNYNALKSENIYYKHDEEIINKGYAMIIGPKNTPYQYGFYFFQFKFPDNYPFEPPQVTFLTNDGKMRFNPNLYTNGKVCLSVLNTWQGDNWTSCQTINSILLILSTILNDKPLLNEPGVIEPNNNINKYNLLVSYKNIEFSILTQYNIIQKIKNDTSILENASILYKILYLFSDLFIELFKNNYEKIINNLNNLNNDLKFIKSIHIFTYNLNYKLNTDILFNDLNKIDFK
tara:strand:+ start:203 stop:952 length:750 start_codon:yes stop_codon:yes gene_type:complete